MTPARVLRIVGVAAALAVAAVAFAQTTVIPVPDNAPVQTAPLSSAPETTTWGDVQNGATLAGTCAACHGLDGNSPDPQYPRLAGQSERYIAQQLAAYRSGARNTGMAAIMMPFAQMLSAQDSRDVGAYFATQASGAGVADDSVITSGPNAGKQFFEVGQQLYLGGDAERGIPSCLACHGPEGGGNPGPAYPRVAGQFADYSKRRLEEYRAAAPAPLADNPHFQTMATIAAKLTDEEIGSLSSYLQGLHPRALDALASATTPVAAAPAAAAPAAAAPVAAPVDPAAAETAAESGSRPLGGQPEQPGDDEAQ